MSYGLILYGKLHETFASNPNLNPSLTVIDLSGISPVPTIGQVYNSQAGTFTDPAVDWDSIRAVRNGLLAACDWTQAADSPLDATAKAAWATYRQDLRDLPADFSTATTYAEITWPTPPA